MEDISYTYLVLYLSSLMTVLIATVYPRGPSAYGNFAVLPDKRVRRCLAQSPGSCGNSAGTSHAELVCVAGVATTRSASLVDRVDGPFGTLISSFDG